MPTFHLNWIDYVIFVCIGYSLFNGWVTGLPHLISNLFSFLGSLWLSVKFHAPVGNFIGEKLGVPTIWTTVLGYIIVAFVSEFILSEIIRIYVNKLPDKIIKSSVSKLLGALFCVVNNSILVTFILLIIVSLPIRGTLKKDIKNSITASILVRVGERYGGTVKSSLDDTVAELNKFLTVEPDSRDRVNLDVDLQYAELVIDSVSEEQMLALLNAERAKVGIGLLKPDVAIQQVARNHSKDMFLQKYFSHYDPEGRDASYRMDTAHIEYALVGENLAYAPDVLIAHKGLMESDGHRRNILDSTYHRVGIGIIDSGTSGRMFTQVFAN